MDNVWYVDFKYIESVSKEIIECRKIKKKKTNAEEIRVCGIFSFSLSSKKATAGSCEIFLDSGYLSPFW